MLVAGRWGVLSPGGRGEGLAHAERVLSPRIVPWEEALHLVSKRPVQLDGGRVSRAHLESDPNRAPSPCRVLCGCKHVLREAAPPRGRHDRDGQDAAHARLEQEHERALQATSRFLHEGETPLVPKDPLEVVPSELAFRETGLLDPDEVFEVPKAGEPEQGRRGARRRHFSLSTSAKG